MRLISLITSSDGLILGTRSGSNLKVLFNIAWAAIDTGNDCPKFIGRQEEQTIPPKMGEKLT